MTFSWLQTIPESNVITMLHVLGKLAYTIHMQSTQALAINQKLKVVNTIFMFANYP